VIPEWLEAQQQIEAERLCVVHMMEVGKPGELDLALVVLVMIDSMANTRTIASKDEIFISQYSTY
jgi:hypothetical protein